MCVHNWLQLDLQKEAQSNRRNVVFTSVSRSDSSCSQVTSGSEDLASRIEDAIASIHSWPQV